MSYTRAGASQLQCTLAELYCQPPLPFARSLFLNSRGGPLCLCPGSAVLNEAYQPSGSFTAWVG